MQNKRNIWVDYAKGIGIILVVYGHVARGVFNAKIPMDTDVYRAIDSAIYTFHMPLFFFLSGLFFYESFSNKKWITFISGKIDTILYPYILWSIIQGSIEVILGNFTNGHVTFNEVFSLLWAPRAQFWFLYSLFQIFLISSLIYIKGNRAILIIISILASFAYLLHFEFFGINFLKSLLPHFCFFSFGVFYNSISSTIYKHKFKVVWPLLLAFIAGQLWFHLYANLDYTSLGWLQFLLALTSILFICIFCQIIEKYHIPPLLALGSFSMTIYLAHVIAASATRIVLKNIFHINNASIHLTLGLFIGLVGPIIFQKICNAIGLSFLFNIPQKLSLANTCKQFNMFKQKRNS